MIDAKKEVFWKYKDEKIEVNLVKFAHDRYATISVNGEKLVLPCYVMEALTDTWHENENKPINIEELREKYIIENTRNWDEETREKYIYEIEEDFKIWIKGYLYYNSVRV